MCLSVEKKSSTDVDYDVIIVGKLHRACRIPLLVIGYVMMMYMAVLPTSL